ncbi:hypothetical protein COU15_02935 [Candidatus Kaiserbacteria bacterium CG10_big_fil_rev_8_21_14_0_10_45_20]|uniref:DUF11 domain-containing protein n=1 Tax=Candidatus Kaiserbacteria bacterium CG10_big_fil_rev_8_21_14_0_10_45_20 TaxID=1974607 RepID=A0A2H0UF30_9BACT|nr:MAG: hypothetical protein COU15_02935 [Candidatus Kaiserbacteria bacterium CG10_big_fil_rev_8_21_14_0_10_45_20]
MRPKSALDRLEKKLDSRSEESAPKERSSLSQHRNKASEEWQSSPASASRPRRRRLRVLDMVFIIAVVFFIIAGIFASVTFFSGNNIVSTRNVSIAIDGPNEIRAGDTLSLNIAVTNHNSVPMELTDLVVEFPDGTRSEVDVSVALPRIRESVGTIEPGQSISKNVRAVLFGTANTNAEVKVSVEYRVPSSNAIFFSEEKYVVPISQSPASITVDALDEVVSGQETVLSVTVTSNVSEKLPGMMLVAEYPPGFSFVSSTPEPVSGSSAWKFGDIEAGGSRKVTIRGRFSGEDGDERVVHFTAGTQNPNDEEAIAAPLATGDASLFVAKPFISAALALGGDIVSEYVANRGAQVRGDIRWTNNLPSRVQDVEIEVKLNGAILDRNNTSADRGFYRSSDNTILFSKESDPRLADVAPGASGVSSFSFASLPLNLGEFRNPEIDISVTVKARRISETSVPENLESNASATVLVSTDLALASSATSLSGPVPPKADVETVYSITWLVTNSVNAVANASVTASLPSYVRWIGNETPNGSEVSFNQVGGVVSWNIGDIGAGESRNVTFQVGVTPSLSQVNRAPTIISDQRVYGFDRFTRRQIERTSSSLDTSSGVPQSQGIVVP